MKFTIPYISVIKIITFFKTPTDLVLKYEKTTLLTNLKTLDKNDPSLFQIIILFRFSTRLIYILRTIIILILQKK